MCKPERSTSLMKIRRSLGSLVCAEMKKSRFLEYNCLGLGAHATSYLAVWSRLDNKRKITRYIKPSDNGYIRCELPFAIIVFCNIYPFIMLKEGTFLYSLTNFIHFCKWDIIGERLSEPTCTDRSFNNVLPYIHSVWLVYGHSVSLT